MLRLVKLSIDNHNSFLVKSKANRVFLSSVVYSSIHGDSLGMFWNNKVLHKVNSIKQAVFNE